MTATAHGRIRSGVGSVAPSRVLSAVPLRAAGRQAGTLAASLAVVVLAWELLSRAYGMPFIFPGPVVVAEAFVDNVLDGSLAEATSASLVRILAGFTAGTLLGIVLGLVTGASRVFRGMTAPFVTFFRFVPPLAWFAPVLVWFGAGETSKIVLVMYTSVFVVALSTLEAGAGVPRDLQRMATATGISWWQRMAWVTLPASVPYIVAGARVAMGNAFMTIVSAEMLGAPAGLGVIINNGMISTNTADVFTSILVLGILGLLFDRLFVLLINTVGKKYRASSSDAVA